VLAEGPLLNRNVTYVRITLTAQNMFP